MEGSLPLESPSMSRRQLLNFITGAALLGVFYEYSNLTLSRN